MAGFSTSYGARAPGAQGGHGGYGAQTPGSNAPNPAAAPTAVPGLRRQSAAPPSRPSARTGRSEGPPTAQTPSVNRDGTIPNPAPAGGSPWDRYNAKIQAGYQTYLGRGASEDELRLHHNNNAQGYDDPGQLNQALGNIQNSDEAFAYRNRAKISSGPAGGPPPPGGGGPPPAVRGGDSGVTSGGGGGGGWQMPDMGPMADEQWRNFVSQNLAPRALSQEDLPTYGGMTMGAYNDPNDPRIAQAQNSLMLRVLQSPESMDANTVMGMKEQQKESSLSMMDQLTGANAQSAAGRGLAGSGYMGQQNFNAQDAAIANITKSYRDIDQMAAATNMADRYKALGMSDQMQSGITNRGLGGYNANLASTGFNAGERFKEYGSQADKTKFGYQRTLDEANLQNQAVQNALGAWNVDLQENLGRFGAQIDMANSQDGGLFRRLGYGLDLAKFGAGQQNNMIRVAQGGQPIG